jgi:hypothetical protein
MQVDGLADVAVACKKLAKGMYIVGKARLLLAAHVI